MSKTRREHKEQLLAEGRWREFSDYKSSLVLGGMSGVAANIQAVEKFLGAEAAKQPSESGSRPPRELEQEKPEKLAPAQPKDRKFAFEKEAEKGSNGKREPNTVKGTIGSVPAPPPPVKENVFKDKPPVGEVENITWVADHMRIVEIDPKDCPSMRAWNMLCECRENAYFRANFWKDHYAKIIPAKSMLENNRRRTAIDGQSTMDLIDRVRATSDRIQGNTTQGDAG